MNELPPGYIEHVKEQARALEARSDPDDAPTAHPWRVAARNSAVAVASIGAVGLVHLIAQPNPAGNPIWWVWFAVALFTVAVCFGHAALGLMVGRRFAANLLKAALGLLLIGMVVWITHGAPFGGK